jgi:DNA or RNA helicases of superfamily II
MQLREYQKNAVAAVYKYLRTTKGNPCLVAPTGSGKSPMIATICRDAVTKWNGRVLILAHVKELLEQTAATLKRIDADLDVGVYSAGLNRRDTNNAIVVAGIQSVHNKADELGVFDLIIVDECHLLSPDGDGRYRTFLNDMRSMNPKVRLIGLTATPYRMRTGMLCGPDNLLTAVCYEIGVLELIESGFLSPLYSKAGKRKIDCSQLGVRGGEFIPADVEKLVDTEANVQGACLEIAQLCTDRHSVLIFAVSVEHARNVQRTIAKFTGEECGLITGETPASERNRLIGRFRGDPNATDLFGDSLPPLRWLVNVNVLTTGFDAPNIDCVVLLRPTLSPGLYAQMVGRGFRLHESKTDCMVLDYGGNILRHGPVDAVRVRSTSGGGVAPAKECPECHLIVMAGTAICPECGFIYPREERDGNKHDSYAADGGVISTEETDVEHDVLEVFYSVHTKRGALPDDPQTVCVEYKVGIGEYVREWLCPEHSGWSRDRFVTWWNARCQEHPPDNADLAVKIANDGAVSAPRRIRVKRIAGSPFPKITRYELPTKKPDCVSLEDIPF